MLVKTPKVYINEPDAILHSGEYVAKYSKNPLIIGSKTALSVVQNNLVKSFQEHGISTEHIETFEGYPSENQFEKYRKLAESFHSDVIIGVGGGRTLDTSKAVGELVGVPVITIPTVLATCAGWAGLTIQYDDEGSFVKGRPLKDSPVLVIADTKVLLTAPKRYLFSGVVDTFAKFYEIRPTFECNEESLNLDIAYYASRVAYTKLETGVFKALEEAEKGIFEQSAKDVVDSIVYLAGFAGSFQTDTGYYSFAHPFYHISARFPNTRHRLHGEKVAYGILAQLFLEKKSVEDIKNVIQTFDKYQNAYTLDEIGFNRDDISELNLLAVDIIETFPHVTANVDDIIQALLDTDTLVKQVRGLN